MLTYSLSTVDGYSFGKILDRFIKGGRFKDVYPADTPDDALRMLLHKISDIGRLKTPFSAIIFCPVSGPCETDCDARRRDPEKNVFPHFISPAKARRRKEKRGKPACRALTLRLCAFAGFRGDMFFPGALKRIGSDMGGQKSGQRKLANLDGLYLT